MRTSGAIATVIVQHVSMGCVPPAPALRTQAARQRYFLYFGKYICPLVVGHTLRMKGERE